MSEEIAAPGKRVAETRERRRRRVASSDSQGPLGLDKSKLDKGYHHHWLNDKPGRIHKMTVQDDYDIVTDPDLAPEINAEGAGVRRLVGTNPDGSPLYSYLCRKPIEYYKADRGEKMREVKEREDALKKGLVKDGLSASDPHAYIPGGKASPMEMETKVVAKRPQHYEP